MIVAFKGDWPAFAGIDWEKHIFHQQVTDRFHSKQGRTIGRRLYFYNDNVLSVFLKRYYTFPWYIRLLAFLFPHKIWSPGLHEWNRLQWALQNGWKVPRPVAAGQWVGPGLRLRSFLAVEELQDMVPLHEAIPQAMQYHSPSSYSEWKRRLLIELVNVIAALHQKRIFHKDLYLCHLYIKLDDIYNPIPEFEGNIYLIDLHRLRRHRLLYFYWLVKDLSQLLFSLYIDGINNEDRQFIFRLYYWKLNISKLALLFLKVLIKFKIYFYRRHAKRAGAK
ncbi:MAG: lipopolysaccharide kinase InaA family protein [Gemmataceae bacterium]|nr:lipopolysaccharide kinase InaA family protein [Gemmataceae bacterium]MDW8242108.1 lipopolysaccharide kinase InaA family protein [Thermogemmata sp.]